MKNSKNSLAYLLGLLIFCGVLTVTGCNESDSVSMQELQALITSGKTEYGVENRVLVVDVRDSESFISGHIQNALSAPLAMIADSTLNPLYTNGYNEVSPTAAEGIANSWLCHMLVNQMVNDYASTYDNSTIIFYGETSDQARSAMAVAEAVGYNNISYLEAGYDAWQSRYPDLAAVYYDGIESINEDAGTFVMAGYINNTNYNNVTSYGTHNCIIFEGGASHNNGMFQTLLPPFCFQELLTYLGASPEGNMADGIDFGATEEWSEKLVNGQRIDYSITWDGEEKYYALEDLLEEKASAYQPDPAAFIAKGIEPRIGGTRDSNINWNPGCIYCSYSCVCGITSNARVNDHTWYDDGGIYDLENMFEDPRNYYAGRFYPRTDILPGTGTDIKIKVQIVKE